MLDGFAHKSLHLQRADRTFVTSTAPVQHVRTTMIYPHILAPGKLLRGQNTIARFDQLRGKLILARVTRWPLGQARLLHGPLKCLLHDGPS